MTTLHFVLMGVAGCGKSSVGELLSAELGLRFVEGDSLHTEASVRKMAAGIPLDDTDRLPWLTRLHDIMSDSKRSLVVSCSALRRSYRSILAANLQVVFVYLEVTQDIARDRVAARHHFFPESLVADQFSKLESPIEVDTIRVDASRSIDVVGKEVLSEIGRRLGA